MSVVVAGTNYQMLEFLALILQSGEGPTSFNNDNSVNFSGEEKYNEEFWGVYFFDNTRKNFKSNLILVVVLVLECKGPYYVRDHRKISSCWA